MLPNIKGAINVMTDCAPLNIMMQGGQCIHFFPLISSGSGAEAPMWALRMLLGAFGKASCINHLPFGGICNLWLDQLDCLSQDAPWLRSSCDSAPGPQAFIKSNFPGVKSGAKFDKFM